MSDCSDVSVLHPNSLGLKLARIEGLPAAAPGYDRANNPGRRMMKYSMRSLALPACTAALLGLAASAGAAGTAQSVAKIRPFNITIQHRFAAPPTNTRCLT